MSEEPHLGAHTLEVLGFTRVREILADFCQTETGREAALGLEPWSDSQAVAAELDRLDEITALADEPRLGEVKDIRPLLERLRASGGLDGEELLRVKMACTGIRRCHEFFQAQGRSLPKVRPLTTALRPQMVLEREIEHAVDEDGQVRDSASPELANTRRRLRSLRNSLVKKLECMAQANPDRFGGAPTVRGGRFVLPLLLEHRAGLPGVIHGSSGSGHTLFVEPLALVAEGNELQELRDAEAEEVARILRRLSGLVAARVSELAAALRAAGELDLLFAKRRFSFRFNGQRPAPAPDDRLELVQARHPLLEHRGVKVVPLDMRCPDGTRVVLISGPNAGGKTVALKTAGLLALMFKAGMYVPAAKGTCMPVFGQVFADIGDEQSLETDLSSFTAHVKRLTEILDKSDAQSLVLIDEIGSSTSPEEGAALAVAVLEELRDRGVRSIVTTHFGALKLFVQDEPGMVNAAMEWGPQDTEVGPMRNGPTYRLRMGLPGESSALEIAAEAGLPSGVIERARARIGRAWLDLGAKLKTLDEELRRARKARSAAEEEQRQSSQTHAALRARLSEAEAAARASAVRLRDVEERLLREKRREIENLVRKIKEQKADHESIVAAKQHVEAALKELEPRPEEESRSSSEVAGLGPGDEVESHTFRRRGSVVEVKGDHATVAFGHIRVALSVADLKLVAPAGVQSEAVVVAEEPFHFDTRLEVIGLTREEAGEAVDRFLDEARMVGSSELTIVHGKGGGVLRRALWERLRGDKRVETITLAEPAAGGSGVTLVRLVQEKAEVENRSPLPPRRREELD